MRSIAKRLFHFRNSLVSREEVCQCTEGKGTGQMCSRYNTLSRFAEARMANQRDLLFAALIALDYASGAQVVAQRDAARVPPTFTRTIAPLLFRHCAVCHHPGEVAPFPLLTYED